VEQSSADLKKTATEVIEQGRAVKEIAATYSELQVGLYEDLLKEFKNDLQNWDATLEKDSTIRFNEPDILFEAGSAKLRDNFKIILDDFFPRYIRLLSSKRYKKDIDEIRIEGHTSSIWENATTKTEIYLKNAHLSQERAYSVLEYCYQLSPITNLHPWLNTVIRANGLSHGIPIKDVNNHEDQARSRRVEFRAVTKSQERILKIVEELKSI